MHNTQHTVLGISLGTTRIGVAVAGKRGLIDWQIKAFDDRWSDVKLNAILNTLESILEHHQITRVALKVPHDGRCSPALKILSSQFKKSAKEKNVQVYVYSINSLKTHWCPEEKSTSRKKLMEAVVSKYPELTHKYRKACKSKYTYHFKLFEAVALTDLLE